MKNKIFCVGLFIDVLQLFNPLNTCHQKFWLLKKLLRKKRRTFPK